MGFIWQNLIPIQIVVHHKAYVKDKALNNKPMTHDTFVFPFEVKDLTNKIVDESQEKHLKDPINVQMWILKNLNSKFYYFQHVLLDLNLSNQDDTLFILKIQMPWQFEIIKKIGDQSLVSFNATFETNQSKVRFPLLLNEM